MSAATTTTTGTGRIPAGSTHLPPAARLREWGRALVLGRRGALVWERPALLGLLAVTAVLYIWNLGASGYANSFYSAAVQAGSVNWEAFFYGSSDAANSITVDKPPASLWFMALSVRLFGLSSWSILLPEAIMGVVTVAVVYATVRRRFSAPTALLAGGVLAITPVAALMFRFNNPDALLVLLLSLATYFTIRGVEDGRIRWVLWAGAMIGFGFLTKQLQAFVLLPPLALVYLWAAPRTFRVRLLHSLAALGAVIVAAGWWVAIVELVPESWRPYIGGSQTNSFLELTFGYNGFGRLTGDETGSVTGGGGGNTGGGMWGSTGITRLFDGEIGGQITWLLPAALVVGVIALVLLRRAPRTSVRRAILVIFGGWMLVTGLAFSFMAGIFHAYYTVALAPAIAAVVAIGATMLWERRSAIWARIVLAAVLLGTAAWAYALLTRASDWMPWLKFVVVGLAVIGAVLLVLPPLGRRIAIATAAVSLIGALAAPAAYSLQTVSEGHTGSIVTAGPSVQGGMGGFGGGRGGGGNGGGFGGGQGGPGGSTGGFPGSSQNGTSNGSSSSQGFGGTPPQGFGPGSTGSGSTTGGGSSTGGSSTGGFPGGGTASGERGGFGGGGAGGLLGASNVSSEVEALLKKNASAYTWAAATIGSNSAAGYQLATELPVMPIGGFNGSDPSPTLAEFQALVKKGEIHYFIASGVSGRSNGGSDAASAISSWVDENYESTTVDGVTLYDLS
ncbi:ArnT family glycosyltransferase [Schumannella soli]|uniref:Glycosyltransferase family 39 protein n=1 Tax=Schumannella soli TaxID=2590779 RepID=A0A506Y816_9MICO|nr:glycosyltransferase family 39 protein [Schumannella soli]TPW77347.1 glycosyltransferase family 39 protein [Schumannella soli]